MSGWISVRLYRERKEFSIKNNKSDLIKMLAQTEKDIGLLDIKRAQEKYVLNKILSSKQRMSNVGDEFSIMHKIMSSGYTISMIPKNAYDAIIFVKKARPTTMID